MPDATSRLPAVPATDPMSPHLMAAASFLSGYLNAGTRSGYAGDLRLYFDWCAAHRIDPLKALRIHVQAYATHLTEERRNAPATVGRRMSTVTSYYGTCVLDGFISSNPSHHLRLPTVHVDPAKMTYLNRWELSAALRTAKDTSPVDWALIALMGTLGMRVTATCNVRVEDFAFTDLGYRTLKTVGKGGKPSVKAVPIPVWQAVEAAIDTRSSGWLLRRRDGSQMTRRSADRVVQRICGKAGIGKRVSPHCLRRSFATLALKAGVDVRVVQAGMDHADPRVTLRYDALGVELHAQASNTVAAILASAS